MLEAVGSLAARTTLMTMWAANDLLLRTGRMRLAASILRMSGYRNIYQDKVPGDWILANQRELAALANISLSKFSVLLKEFEADGYVSVKYGRIQLIDPAALDAVIRLGHGNH